MNIKSFFHHTFLISCTLLLAISPASAQFTSITYGKNRVQYKQFTWQYVASQNFEVFYYGSGEELARMTANLAEQDFSNITDMVGFAPYSKIKVFVYQSMAELHQSNMGVDRQNFTVAGQTNFTKAEIEIAFTGARDTYKKELSLSIAENLIFEMMYGGNLKDMLQSTYLLNLPDWFMAGAARYIAEGWSTQMDDYMRDVLKNKRVRKVSNLEGQEAYFIGQSIWNFIVEKYGRANVANILNLTRIVRNEESSIQNTLGISFPRFLNNWRAYYLDQAKAIEGAHLVPDLANRTHANEKENVFSALKLSPKGDQLAYVENSKGRYRLRVRDLASGREKTVLTGGYQVINQKIDYELPKFAWRDNGNLVAIGTAEGKLWRWDLAVAKGRKAKKPLGELGQVLAIDIAADGELAVLSAAAGDRSDLYLYDLASGSLTRLTNDNFDDLTPAFVKGSKSNAIVFSSNRESDTLGTKTKNTNTLDDRFSLFLYDPAKSKTVLKRLTNTLSHDIAPVSLPGGSIFYDSDQRGIHHLYRYDAKDEVNTQVTNFLYSVTSYSIVGDRLAFVMNFAGRPQIFVYSGFDAKASIFTNKTNRQQLVDLRRLAAIRAKNERDNQVTFGSKDRKDTVPKPKEEEPEKKDEQKPAPKAAVDTTKKNPNEADTENYQFDIFSKPKEKEPKTKLLKNYRPTIANTGEGQTAQLTGPFAYDSKFSADNLVTSIVIDPLRGWGVLLETSLSDALENHKFNAGLFGLTSLRSGMYYAEYKYLKGRLDYKMRYDRQNLALEPGEFVHRYAMNRLTASVSYPFNITSRLTFSPFWAATQFDVTSDRSAAIQALPGSNFQYAGASLEFVYDNSIVTGPNLLEGNRLLVRYEQWLGTNSGDKSFGNLTADARTYKKLGRFFVFAGRAAYGQFFGQAGKTYRLGGVNNWIFNQTDPMPVRDPLALNPNVPGQDLSDLLFVQYVGNMRGFNWNKLRGNTYILFNAEIRMPLLKYFYKSAITSNFFRNLQLVAFTDVGASWTGISPFNRQNALNTIEDERVPFAWRASNFRNPFLVGAGTGLRTSLLGYYTKFDIAWGLESGRIQEPIFYVSLGYDF
jgi:Tol biopolymer transport system component